MPFVSQIDSDEIYSIEHSHIVAIDFASCFGIAEAIIADCIMDIDQTCQKFSIFLVRTNYFAYNRLL